VSKCLCNVSSIGSVWWLGGGGTDMSGHKGAVAGRVCPVRWGMVADNEGETPELYTSGADVL